MKRLRYDTLTMRSNFSLNWTAGRALRFLARDIPAASYFSR
jgi:hypothetical protein